ncbi:MAG: sigma-54-dependent Fis family transcriptional regulator [Planctomycetes bacterium]|nr:sigma-54-dependent Fis family transcriptional regulator [Planctomycetota bacterium]
MSTEPKTASGQPGHAKTETGKILIIDDEVSICELLSIILKKEGYEVTTSTESKHGLLLFQTALAHDPFDLVIQDVRMPDMDGLALLKKFKELDPSTLSIVITAFSTYDVAVEAMRLGAYDYIKKPFDNETEIKPTVKRAIQFRQIINSFANKENPDKYQIGLPLRMIIGSTPQMKSIYELIRRVAQTDSTVLIQGESGTGKELVARTLHYQSSRLYEPFITVNCGAFTETLLESELFGHVKGSFTNAYYDKKGLIEVANKGTFFLDEVSELSPQLQVKLLRVIETKDFKPVGATENKKVDVRFITATNTNLDEQVKKGLFREDLFYRLNVISIQLPPLSDRKDDIPLLAGHFLSKYNKMMKKEVSEFTPDAMEALLTYHWPGNVRELENTVQRAVALCQGNAIHVEDLNLRLEPLAVESSGTDGDLLQGTANLDKKMEHIEKIYILKAIRSAQGNMTEAAKMLGITFRSLRHKVKKYNIKI